MLKVEGRKLIQDIRPLTGYGGWHILGILGGYSMRVIKVKGGIQSETLSQEERKKIGHRMKRNCPTEYRRETVKETIEH